MRKLLYVLPLLIALTLPFMPARAANVGEEPPASLTFTTNIPTTGPTTLNEWYKIVQDVIGWIFLAAIILGVIAIIIAGIIYITSAGSARAQLAGKMIIYAVVGIAVAALAWAIVNLVGNFFVGDTLIS